MKNIKLIALSIFCFTLFYSCSDDDNPAPVNEEEVITTVRLTLTPTTTGDTVVFLSQDLDGDGPGAPVNSVTGSMSASTLYTGEIEFLNELENPAEDITEEVIEEADEHQVFYQFTGTAGSSATYTDTDANGNPVGVMINLNSGDAAMNNTLTVTLRHEPIKDAVNVANGDITNADGETDIEVTFTYNVN